MKIKIFLFSLGILLFFPFLSKAETFVSGSVSENIIWDKTGSPYIIEGDVIINLGINLSIKPGTIIKFNQGASLNILGGFEALGTSDEKIYFTSINNDSLGGDTNGDGNDSEPYSTDDWEIYFNNSKNSVLKNVEVSYSGNGFYLDNATADFDGLEFEDSANGIFVSNGSSVNIKSLNIHDIDNEALLSSKSTINIDSSTFERINNWSDAVSIFDSTLNLKNSFFRDILDSNISLYGSNAFIDNTEFSAGLSSALELYDNRSRSIGSYLKLTNSLIEDFGYTGIAIYNSQALVENSSIKRNFDGFEVYKSARSLATTSLSIISSSIVENATEGIYNYADIVIEAKNNWWGDLSGPYEEGLNPEGLGDGVVSYAGSVEFFPWLKEDPNSKKICCSSVVFLPGLESSRLYKQGTIFENQLWEPNRNADVEKLFLDADGKSLDSNVYTRDILDEAFVFNVYKSFIENMDDMVSEGKISEWKPFPYDWRFDVNEIVSNDVKLQNNTVYNMVTEIKRMASESDTGMVTIISHSNGGLVAKALIKKLEDEGLENIVDRLVLVASPQVGTPQAIAGLLHGDKADIPFVLSKSTAREFGENMLGGYGLLPSEKYFETVENPVIVFDPSVSKVKNWITEYGDSVNDFSSLSDFLLGKKDGRVEPEASNTDEPNILKENLLSVAVSTHSVLDSWNVPKNIEVTEIVGWGIPTLSGIKYVSKEECSPLITPCHLVDVLDREPIVTADGDETVVSPSALIQNNKIYYINLFNHNKLLEFNKNRKHVDILETESINLLIKNLVTGIDGDLPKYITVDKPEASDSLELSVHSPVSIDVYDYLGNHTGIVQNPDPTSDLLIIEEKIPNSVYMNFGEGKYIWLDGENNYKVSLKGTGIGTFTFKSKNTEDSSGFIFEDIPVTTDTLAEINLDTTSTTPILKIDIDGNGVFDANISGENPLNPIEYLGLMKIVVQSMGVENSVKKDIIKKIDKIILVLQKNKNDRAIEKINKFGKFLEAKAKKTHPKRHKQKITKEEAEELINMLNNLLDNLLKK